MKTETWTVDSDRAYYKLVISNQEGDVICESEEDETGTKRAKLIAAAPRMLLMLQDGAFQLERLTGENLEVYARTFAALAQSLITRATV